MKRSIKADLEGVIYMASGTCRFVVALFALVAIPVSFLGAYELYPILEPFYVKMTPLGLKSHQDLMMIFFYFITWRFVLSLLVAFPRMVSNMTAADLESIEYMKEKMEKGGYKRPVFLLALNRVTSALGKKKT